MRVFQEQQEHGVVVGGPRQAGHPHVRLRHINVKLGVVEQEAARVRPGVGQLMPGLLRLGIV